MTDPSDLEPPLRWCSPPAERAERGRLRYRGPLASDGRRLMLHHGFDGWGGPVADVPMDRDADGTWTAEVDTAGHRLVDAVVFDEPSSRYDNNDHADYRLWIGCDPIDAHVHVRSRVGESMSMASLRTALWSGGMTHGLVSWRNNRFVDRVTGDLPWLSPLVWVSPAGPRVVDVRRRLDRRAVGLKLHPAFDNYPADAAWLDPYLEVAADAQVPVTVHSSPGPADPALIRILAERFPMVDFVLYHTYLGPFEGRHRASRYAHDLPNLYLETSWCGSGEAERLIDELGPDRVLFGSDAAVDGPYHFVRQPPNIEMAENYNGVLLHLANRLPPEVFAQFVRGNVLRLFRLSSVEPAGA